MKTKIYLMAIFGAVSWKNLTGENVTIAIGPFHNSKLWHAQAAVVDKYHMIKGWLVWNGREWKIGKKEPFIINELIDVETFVSGTINGKYGGIGFKKILNSTAK